MKRIAFKMQLNKGAEAEYKKRHDELCGKSTQIDSHRPKQTNPHRPFQIDPLIPA